MYMNIYWYRYILPSTWLQAIFPKRRFHTFWEQIHFKAGVGVPLTQEAYVGNVTKDYISDPVAFRKEYRAALTDLASLLDTNENCLIEKDEVEKGLLKQPGYNSTVSKNLLKNYYVYNNSNSGPIKVFIDAWLQFRTNEHRIWDDPVQDTLKSMEEAHENIF